MVSSKCCHGESPSPFVFTAPLMPPWAQTEWERLTGTMENSLTGTFASAALIVAIRPAKPPPTTIRHCLLIPCHSFPDYEPSAIAAFRKARSAATPMYETKTKMAIVT